MPNSITHASILSTDRAALMGAARRRGPFPASSPGFLLTIRSWMERSRQRYALLGLAEPNDRLLKDIGVSRKAALLEADKPFWR